MNIHSKIKKITAVVLSVGVAGLFGMAGYYSSRLPEVLISENGSEVSIAAFPEIECGKTVQASGVFPASEQATLSLFGAIPVKNVRIHQEETPVLLVGGRPFGIKLLMEGVMVTELGSVSSGKCPAADAGIKAGDIIKSANDMPVASNSELQRIISCGKGSEVKLSVSRDGKDMTIYLKPVFSEKTGKWLGGMWVRDSIAGIGTMTFINGDTGEFAGLGHPVCDADTGGLVPVHSGEAVPVEITETKKGSVGVPGELHGNFTSGTYGSLFRNNSCGVYGQLTEAGLAVLSEGTKSYKLGYRQEVTTGEAYIYSTVSGTQPECYSINIESVDYSSGDDVRNMVIRITDERLIETTGGIIQGMSGSPIIQNDKLIGAVTHVFVSDPTKGYAIFAENMVQYIK